MIMIYLGLLIGIVRSMEYSRQYQIILVKGKSDLDGNEHIYVNITNIHNPIVKLDIDSQLVRIRSQYPRMYTKMNQEDFSFRVFSQKMYLYRLGYRIVNDTSELDARQVMKEIMINQTGINRLNELGLDYKLDYQLVKNIPGQFYKAETMCDIVVMKEQTTRMYSGQIEVQLCNLMEPLYIDQLIVDTPYIYDKYIDTSQDVMNPDEF